MSGYVVNLRLRRAGAPSTTERTWAVPDKELTRLGWRAFFTLGVLLLLLAPFAMTALTMPESARAERITYQHPVAFAVD